MDTLNARRDLRAAGNTNDLEVGRLSGLDTLTDRLSRVMHFNYRKVPIKVCNFGYRSRRLIPIRFPLRLPRIENTLYTNSMCMILATMKH